jgi:hypothetical protein
MKELLMRAWLPKSEKDYWKKPFLLLCFSLVLLMATEIIKSQKETNITIPDKFNVDSKSNITFNAEQYNGLISAVKELNTKPPVVITNHIAPVANKGKVKRKKRWHPLRKAGYY